MPLTPIQIEAELMNLSTYRVESGNTAASGGGLISLYQATGSVGAASTFCGSLRHHDMILGYFDENDGVAQLEVRVGELAGCVELNQNPSPGPSAQSLVRTTTRGYRSTRGEDRDRRNTQPGRAGTG